MLTSGLSVCNLTEQLCDWLVVLGPARAPPISVKLFSMYHLMGEKKPGLQQNYSATDTDKHLIIIID